MRTAWPAHYLDGRTAVRRPATVWLGPTGLDIALEGGEAFTWPLADLRQTQGTYRGEPVRLERRSGLPGVLVVADAGFLAAFRALAPGRTAQLRGPGRRDVRFWATAAAAIAVVGLAAALYRWGIPAVVAVVASLVPVSWEERLGDTVVEHLAPPGRRCANPAAQRVIDAIVARLTATLPRPEYRIRVIVLDDPAVNAFAAPGGPLVLLRGLVAGTETAEELAGVLAHEIQHVVRRHATRTLLEHVSTGLLVAAVAGDVSGIASFGVESARTLGALSYGRRNEEEADREGMRMLAAAGIDPAGMIRFFRSLGDAHGPGGGLRAYLSTHPATGDRIAALSARAQHGSFPRLLPDVAWRDVHAICAPAPA